MDLVRGSPRRCVGGVGRLQVEGQEGETTSAVAAPTANQTNTSRHRPKMSPSIQTPPPESVPAHSFPPIHLSDASGRRGFCGRALRKTAPPPPTSPTYAPRTRWRLASTESAILYYYTTIIDPNFNPNPNLGREGGWLRFGLRGRRQEKEAAAEAQGPRRAEQRAGRRPRLWRC